MLRTAAAAIVLRLVSGHSAGDPTGMSSWTKPATPASVTVQTVEYTVGEETMEGYLAKPATGEPLGGILLVHGWKGLLDYHHARAEQFAAKGFTVFAPDIYGKGIRCPDPVDYMACAQQKMNEAMANITRAMDVISSGTAELLKHYTDKTKLLAMGYCFGGRVVLELARHPMKGASEGVTFKAVSAIHTLFEPFETAAAEGETVARVQVHHAQKDFLGDAGLSGFETEFTKGVTNSVGIFESIKYGELYHGWTEPASDKYDARGAVQAHESTEVFFRMALGLDDPAAEPFPSKTCEAPPPAGVPVWAFVTVLVAAVLLLGAVIFLGMRKPAPAGAVELA